MAHPVVQAGLEFMTILLPQSLKAGIAVVGYSNWNGKAKGGKKLHK